MSLIKKTAKAMADVIPGLGHFTYDDDSYGPVFITSGSGVVGYRVALSLIKAGHKDVRVGMWKGDRHNAERGFGQECADVLTRMGAKIIDFDWTNEGDYELAINGVKTVFCTLPHIEGWGDLFPAFLKVCKKHKVEHFVKVSFLRPNHGFKGVTKVANQYRESVPFVKFHGVCDDLLEQAKNDSRISYTILACSHLMTTPLIMQGKLLREEHKFVCASYGMGVNYVSPNDVADAAVVCILHQGDYRNKVYNLTGPGPIYDEQVCELLSNRFEKEKGHKIEYVEMSYHKYKANALKRGMPEWEVKDAAAFERMKASGVDELSASYTDDVEKITGHKAETFEDYLNNIFAMRPGMTFP